MFPIPQFQHFSISAFQLFPAAPHSRFKVQGSRFKVQGSRFKVQGSRFKVQGSRFKVRGSTVQGSRFKVRGSRFKVRGSRFEVQGSTVQGSKVLQRLRVAFCHESPGQGQALQTVNGRPPSNRQGSHLTLVGRRSAELKAGQCGLPVIGSQPSQFPRCSRGPGRAKRFGLLPSNLLIGLFS